MVRVVDQWLEVESDLVSVQARAHGRLHVDIGSAMVTMLVLPTLPDFQKRYPELQLGIGVSDRPVDLLGYRVDFVILGVALNDPSLTARRMGSLKLITCATSEYLGTHAIARTQKNWKRTTRWFATFSPEPLAVCSWSS